MLMWNILTMAMMKILNVPSWAAKTIIIVFVIIIIVIMNVLSWAAKTNIIIIIIVIMNVLS